MSASAGLKPTTFPRTRPAQYRAVLRIPDPPTGQTITDGNLPKPKQVFVPTVQAAEDWALSVLPGTPTGSAVEIYRQTEELVRTVPE